MSRFCSNCGTRLEEIEAFCHNCGQPVATRTPAPPVAPVPPQSYRPPVAPPQQTYSPPVAPPVAPQRTYSPPSAPPPTFGQMPVAAPPPPKEKNKTGLVIAAAAGFLVVVVLVIVLISSLLKDNGSKPTETTRETRQTTAETSDETTGTTETTQPTTAALELIPFPVELMVGQPSEIACSLKAPDIIIPANYRSLDYVVYLQCWTDQGASEALIKIGRASCRERV